MKRTILWAVAVLMLSLPVVASAQSKVDRNAVLKRIERSNTDIENPKKNVKPNVWIDRGRMFVQISNEGMSGLFMGMPEVDLIEKYGKSKNISNTTIDGMPLQVWTYPHFKAYVNNSTVMFWEPVDIVYENALDQAFDAYKKAYEVDPKSKARVKTGMEELSNFYKQTAGNYFALHQYANSAYNFEKAYEVQKFPVINIVDTACIYNAGFLYTISMQFDKGLPALQEAEKYGYTNDGDVYYYMFHCYYGMNELEQAKNILLKGLNQYAHNNKIIEGLVGIYSETNSDPRDILPLVEEAIKEDPENPSLVSGMARIYEKLEDYDKAVEYYNKAIQLNPNSFASNFSLGLLYVKFGDHVNAQMSETNYSNQADYNADLQKIFDYYSLSVPPLERALELHPNEPITIELLKNVTFRLREQEGMQNKYEKYDALFKQMSGE